MKIVQIITPTRISGAEKYLHNLSQELSNHKHRVIAIIETSQRLIDYIKNDIEVIPLKIEGKGNLFGYYRLKNLIREINPDIIHTHLTTASWFGGFIGKSLKIPVVSTVHALNEKWPYARADKIIAVSNAVYTNLLKQNVPLQQLEAVQNGIPLPDKLIMSDSKINELKHQFNIPAHHQVIGCVAHFSKKKGHEYLLKAFSQLQNKNVTLLLIGEGSLEGKLIKLCRQLFIYERVIFSGFQSEMDKIYPLIDILILPSIKGEGLPLSILEAMNYELPVIASDISGVGEAVSNNENGYLVSPKNISEITRKIDLLLKDRELQKKWGKNGKIKVEQHFNIKKNAQRIVKIYEKLI